ncbi:DUF1559 domain-containing protein [Schlesneria sp. DSM 10557]|uniref:DUF1559 domain-containing protein n=1 Tax=Schlesneria sp. DSM 10557 TaxID=3044399 RepID=UPI0035A15E30
MYYLHEYSSVPRAWVIGVHLVLLTLAVGAMVTAYRQSHRPARPLALAIWFLGTGVLTLFAVMKGEQFPATARPFIYGYIAFIWSVLAFGVCLTFMRGRIPSDQLESRGTGRQVFAALGMVLSLGLVIALLLPAVPHAGEAARRTECRNRLKKIGLAFRDFEEAKSTFPGSRNGDPPHSWRTAILPYLDQSELYEKYDFTTDWDSTANEPVARTPVRFYQCPAREHLHVDKLTRDEQGRYYSHYAMIDGPGTVGPGVRSGEIADGTSSTMLVVEACGLNIVWTEPRDVNVDTQPEGINLPSPTPGLSPGWASSHHRGGVQVLLADGSVRFVSEKIDPQTLKAMTTISGNDALGDF